MVDGGRLARVERRGRAGGIKVRPDRSRGAGVIKLASLALILGSFLSGRAAAQASSSAGDTARSSSGLTAFVHHTPDRRVATSLGEEEASEIWIASARGGKPRRLVVGRAAKPADSVTRTLAAMSSPKFSPDGRRVYFLSSAWVTSDAVHAVDVATGREWFIAPGNSIAIIPRGRYAGCLLVSQHRYRPNEGGSFDWTWLLGTDGKEIALAASDSAAEEERLATWMRGKIPAGAFRKSHQPVKPRCH